MEPILSGKDLLFTLLLKVGAAASLAALLARSATFRKVLYTEMRNSDEKVQLLLFMAPVLVIGPESMTFAKDSGVIDAIFQAVVLPALKTDAEKGKNR